MEDDFQQLSLRQSTEFLTLLDVATTRNYLLVSMIQIKGQIAQHMETKRCGFQYKYGFMFGYVGNGFTLTVTMVLRSADGLLLNAENYRPDYVTSVNIWFRSVQFLSAL